MMNNRQRIEEAHRLLKEVRDTLREDEVVCDHCHRETKLHWTEHQLNDRLKGMTQRLAEIVEHTSKRSAAYQEIMDRVERPATEKTNPEGHKPEEPS